MARVPALQQAAREAREASVVVAEARQHAELSPNTQVAEQVGEALGRTLAGTTDAISEVAKQAALVGLVPDDVQEQMREQALLASRTALPVPTGMHSAGEVARSMSRSWLPITDAVAKARMSPAFGGTFHPSSGAVAARPVAPRFPAVQNPLLDPCLPVPRRRRVTRPTPVKPMPVQPHVLPEELGEVLARALTRADRQGAEELLVETGLDFELEHFKAIEVRLLGGSLSDRNHAALSASLVFKGLADRLFKPRVEKWRSRFDTEHDVGPKNVVNRLSAYVDSRLRSDFSTQEHKLFQATLDHVHRWSAEGHHVPFTPREGAEAYCQFLRVLAAIRRAYNHPV